MAKKVEFRLPNVANIEEIHKKLGLEVCLELLHFHSFSHTIRLKIRFEYYQL